MLRFLPFLLALALALVLTVDAAASTTTGARSVSLGDATRAPSAMVMVSAGDSYHHHAQCGTYVDDADARYFADTSAYYWNGAALRAQRWNSDRTLTYWKAHRRHGGGRVTFDGVRWHNGTRHAVLVAGWCS